MKKFKIITAILIIFSVILTGCNNKNIKEEDVNYILNNIKIKNLNKLEFDTSNNTLIININEEFINDKDVEEVIKNISLNDLTGFEAFNKNNIKNNIFNVKIDNIQNNIITFSTANTKEYKTEYNTNKYTNEYIEKNLVEIIKNIISLNDIIGRIEVELKQKRLSDDKTEKLRKEKKVLLDNINFFSKFNSDNSNYEKIVDINSTLNKASNLVELIANHAEISISSKNPIHIENNFLIINDLDKIARDLKNKNY